MSNLEVREKKHIGWGLANCRVRKNGRDTGGEPVLLGEIIVINFRDGFQIERSPDRGVVRLAKTKKDMLQFFSANFFSVPHL